MSVKICISSNTDNDKDTPKLLFNTSSVMLPLHKSLKNVLSEVLIFYCISGIKLD